MKSRNGLPKTKFNSLETGQMEVAQKEGMTVFHWKDKRDVFMLSTIHDKSMQNVGRQNRTTGDEIVKPRCVIDYNKNIGGVYLCDSVLHAYPSMRKTIKWYKKVFFHIIDIALFNALVMYRSLGHSNVSL
jgi:hypothetical protein